jgi:UDP-glucose 4-epimerase
MILVTGAGGFVGTVLCRDLAAANQPHRSISRTPGPNSISLGEIGPATDWTDVLARVNTVVHLAARVHVMQDSHANPIAAYRVMNMEATLNLARQAQAHGARRFVFVSSIKVNGEGTSPRKPFTAEDRPAPADPYGQSKLEAEMALTQFAVKTGLEVVIIRPPLVYGPGVKANFRSMLTWVERGIPLPLGAVRNKRSFVAVENLTDLIIRCINHPAAAGETFLVSDGEDLSTPDLLRALAKSLRRPLRLVSVPVPMLKAAAALLGQQASVQRLIGSLEVDISRTRSLLEWTPPLSVEAAFARAAAEGW